MQHVSRTPPSGQNQTIDQKLLFQMQLFHKILRRLQRRLFQISKIKLDKKKYSQVLRLKKPTQVDCLANFRGTKFRHLAFEIILLTSNDLKSCWKSFPDVNASSAIAVIWQHFARHESHLPFHWKKSKILAIDVILNQWNVMSHNLWIIGPKIVWDF